MSKQSVAATKRAATRKRNAARRKLHATLRHKRLLKAGGNLAAEARLQKAGCISIDAIRRRLLWLAHERKLSPAQIKNVLKCRHTDFGGLITQHRISAEWLLMGNLKALQRMQRGWRQ
jgi:hypothetical protein